MHGLHGLCVCVAGACERKVCYAVDPGTCMLPFSSWQLQLSAAAPRRLVQCGPAIGCRVGQPWHCIEAYKVLHSGLLTAVPNQP